MALLRATTKKYDFADKRRLLRRRRRCDGVFDLRLTNRALYRVARGSYERERESTNGKGDRGEKGTRERATRRRRRREENRSMASPCVVRTRRLPRRGLTRIKRDDRDSRADSMKPVQLIFTCFLRRPSGLNESTVSLPSPSARLVRSPPGLSRKRIYTQVYIYTYVHERVKLCVRARMCVRRAHERDAHMYARS